MVEEVLDSTQLIEYVINVSKDVFKEDEKYIGRTRINKLTISVFEELSKRDIEVEGFVWGYYRYGFYSPNTNRYIDNKFGQEFNLSHINKIYTEITEHMYWIFFIIITELKPYFVQDKYDFPKWVYSEKTPKEYRSFYKSHRGLEKWFKDIEQDITNKDFQRTLFNKIDRNINLKITNYHRSLWYVEDREILELFYRWTDSLEDLTLKFNNGYDSYRIKFYLGKLKDLYNIIFNMLTPYLQTLEGDPKARDMEIKKHNLKVESIKADMNMKLDKIYDTFKEEGILPTFDETQKELQELVDNSPPGTRSVDEIYDVLFGSSDDTSK